MSPQQVDGENHPSNDIYSLAATLYEALCGSPPFTTGDIYQQIKSRPAPPLANQPQAVNDALLAGLAKEAEDRPHTARALVAALGGETSLDREVPEGATRRPDPRGRAPHEKTDKTAMWLLRSAERGEVGAQYRLARCLEHGDGTAVDHEQAVDWYREAAEQGHAEAAYRLAQCFERGRGVEQDLQKAAQWYDKATDLLESGGTGKNAEMTAADLLLALAETECPAAQIRIAKAYRHGELGLAPDVGQAIEWLKKAVPRHDASKYELGVLLCEPGDHNDVPAAARWLHEWFRSSDADEQWRDGASHFLGVKGLLKNKLKKNEQAIAFTILQKGADLGDVDCRYLMAMCYLKGTGVEKNTKKGGHLLGMLHDKDRHAEAAYRLGRLHLENDSPLARAVFSRAAELASDETNQHPCTTMSRVDLLLRLAERSCAEAQLELGRVYRDGKFGAVRDLEAAIEWLRKAASNPNRPDARSALDLGKLLCVKGSHCDPPQGARWLEDWSRSPHPDLNTVEGDLVELRMVEAAQAILDHKVGPEEQAIAFKILQRGADRESPDCLLGMAKCYLKGVGVERSEPKAIEHLVRVAENDVSSRPQNAAQQMLRRFAQQGIVVPKEFDPGYDKQRERRENRRYFWLRLGRYPLALIKSLPDLWAYLSEDGFIGLIGSMVFGVGAGVLFLLGAVACRWLDFIPWEPSLGIAFWVGLGALWGLMGLEGLVKVYGRTA